MGSAHGKPQSVTTPAGFPRHSGAAIRLFHREAPAPGRALDEAAWGVA